MNDAVRFFAACEIRGSNLVVARRCAVCGALATVNDGMDRVMGRLPEKCRLEHDNTTVEVPVVVPNPARDDVRKAIG